MAARAKRRPPGHGLEGPESFLGSSPRSPDSRTERGVLGEPRGPTVHGSESCLLPPYTALASGDPQDREGP